MNGLMGGRNEIEEVSKENLQNILKYFPGSFVLMKTDIPKFTIVEASDIYLQVTHKSREEIIGKGLFEVFPENPETKDKGGADLLIASLSKTIREKKAEKLSSIKYDIPLSEPGKFEERFWSPVHQPIQNKHGEVEYVMQFVEDVTEIVKLRENQKQINEKLKFEQEKLIEFFQQAPVAICILKGTDFIVELANPSFCNLVGRKFGELMNQPFFDAVDEMKEQGYEKLLNQVYSTGESYRGNEVPAQVFKGHRLEEVYFDFVYEPYKSATGIISGVFVVAIEVTEQVKLRREIESREQRLEFSLQASRMGIWELDLETETVIRNKRHDEIFGYASPVDNWNYEIFKEHIYPDDIPQVRNYYEELKKGKYLDTEIRIIRNDNELRWVELKGQTILDEKGKAKKVFGVVADITERKQLEKQKDEAMLAIREYNEELEEVNRAKDKFISVISHDLRNPLSSILSSSDIVLQGLPSLETKEIEKFVGVINKSSRKIVSQLNDLVKWSQTKDKKIIFNPELLILNRVINTSLQILESAALHKKIRIINRIPEELSVKADPLLLRSIVQNLVSNAIKFTPEDGVVVIEAKNRKDEFVEIRVKDSGIGMTDEFIENIFNEHEIVSTSGTGQEKGSGLGLKLVKEFIEKHGGKIWVESEPGEGTCFAFTIPKS